MLFLCLFSNCIVFEFEIEQTLFTLKMKWCRVKLHLNKKTSIIRLPLIFYDECIYTVFQQDDRNIFWILLVFTIDLTIGHQVIIGMPVIVISPNSSHFYLKSVLIECSPFFHTPAFNSFRKRIWNRLGPSLESLLRMHVNARICIILMLLRHIRTSLFSSSYTNDAFCMSYPILSWNISMYTKNIKTVI